MSLPAPAPGHVAVVTGASSGIGADIARELAKRGHELVLVARSGDKLQELADEVATTAHVVPLDLADPEARAGLLADLEGRGLVPQILVNNAGLSTTRSLAGELKGTGVTPTVLCPGPVDTGFGAAAGFSKEEADDALPRIMWLPAAEVARQAVAGMDKGTLVVIPGVANKLGASF